MADAVGMETDDVLDRDGRSKKRLKKFGRLVGFITRSQIIVLLKRHHFLENIQPDDSSYLDSLNPTLSHRITSTTSFPQNHHHFRTQSHDSPDSAGLSRGFHSSSQPALHVRFEGSSPPSCPSPRTMSELPYLKSADFRDAYPRYPHIDTLNIPEEEYNCHIDFRPYMNDSPYHMNYRATLPRLFSLFRALGLRHVTITDNQNFVVGIVTRVDIARFREVSHCGSNQTHEVLPITKSSKTE